MSPRAPSTSSPTTSAARSNSAPYQRRPSGQPKSTRQQFSACGACRMRRVRCDLKDLPMPNTGPIPACSNCKERGLKCVDEFADVKAVKLLRRGRRLQQVEAIYGKATDGHTSPNLASPATHLPSIIPQLKAEFFSSPFWRWFSLQRPILDSSEFVARFSAHIKGTHPLGHEGSVISLLLVVWAASYGVDEYGVPVDQDDQGFDSSHSMSHNDFAASGRSTRSGVSTSLSRTSKQTRESSKTRYSRRDAIENMLREILELVDYHSILRKPSWDGVRVLLLLLPLLEDSRALEKQAIREAAMLHANALVLQSPSNTSSASLSPDEFLERARIFWYAHIQEGIMTGIHGGRLILLDDDLDTFQRTLPPYGYSSPGSSPYLSGSHPYTQLTHLFAIPLRISTVCRRMHTLLTGPKAARRAEEGGGVDGEGIREILDGLQRCWEDLESVKRPGAIDMEVDSQVERFASAWQIFVFECYHRVRESLKHFLSRSHPTASSSPQPMFSAHPSPRGSPHGQSSPPPYYTLQQLHGMATRKCMQILPYVLGVIKHHLTCDFGDMAGMFRWDTGLVREGCYLAGYLSASTDASTLMDYDSNPTTFGHMKSESDSRMDASTSSVHSAYLPVVDPDEGVALSMRALAEMRWAFSKSDQRHENLRLVWEDRKLHERNSQSYSHPHTPISMEQRNGELEMRYGEPQAQGSFVNVYSKMSHHLPPLNISNLSTSHSAPPTAYSTDSSTGAHGWPSYTPPGTSTSTSGTSATGTSMRSPVFSNLAPVPSTTIKSEGILYQHHTADLEPFTFSPPPGAGPPDVNVMVGYHSHAPRNVSNGFMDFSQPVSSALTEAGGISFAEDGGYYH
nr:ZCP1 [Flammulina filiformis]